MSEPEPKSTPDADLARALGEALDGAEPRPALDALAASAEPGAFARALLGAVAAGQARETTHAQWLVAYAAHALLHELHDEEGAKEALHWGACGLLATAGAEDAAFELLHDIFELDPVYPPLLRTVAEYHQKNAEPGEALRFYERYLELAPGAVDAAVIELRCGEIALAYGDADEATRRLEAAVASILPEGEHAGAALLGARLAALHPGDPRLGGIDAMLATQASAPTQLERDLHRWSRRAQGADRPTVARRLGRLREVRLGDPEGAVLAYRHALRFAPADLQSLDGLERVLGHAPLEVLRAALAALAAAADDDTRRALHRLAARLAWRAGDAGVAADHRVAEARLSPQDRTVRRRAATTLRALARHADLIEILGIEAAYGDRVGALLAGAELFADSLDRADAALAWAEEALLAARESGREQEVTRAALLVERAREVARHTPTPIDAAPPARVQVPPHDADPTSTHDDHNPFGVASASDLLPRLGASRSPLATAKPAADLDDAPIELDDVAP